MSSQQSADIRFGDGFPDLVCYENQFWDLEETHVVEFFPGVSYPVLLISTETENFCDILNSYDDGNPIALDLEWETELCLFQFCTSKGVLVVRHPPGKANNDLRIFLKTHKFFAKGIHNDKVQLRNKFSENFAENIEDIARTRLQSYGFSENFMSMTVQFAGEPTAVFKDSAITTSDWSVENLTARQILYAAFDVVALHQCYPNFPPPKLLEKVKKEKPVVQVPTRRTVSEPVKQPKKLKVFKEFSYRAVLKTTTARTIHAYLIEGYEGPTTVLDIPEICVGIDSSLIDYVGVYSGYLMISLYADIHPTLLHGYASMRKLPELDPTDFSDMDIYFLPKSRQYFESENEMNVFFFAFGRDHVITSEECYMKVHIHNAQSSLRFRTYIPYLLLDDGNALPFDTFPMFLPMVRAVVPRDYSEEDITKLFSEFGNVTNVSILRKRREDHPSTAIITFATCTEAANALAINYRKVDDTTIYAFRFTDENHLRAIRSNEILCKENCSNEIEFRRRCSMYGDVFHAYWDSLLGVGRVQYLEKKAISRALAAEVSFEKIPYDTIAFIRNLPLSVTEKEILDMASKYGVVKGLIFRDLDEFMRKCVVEIIYETGEQAIALKNAVHKRKYGDDKLDVNAVDSKTCEAPIWKMHQRKCCIGSPDFKNREDAYNQCLPFGRIVSIIETENMIYVRFLNCESANSAVAAIEGATIPTPHEFTTSMDPGSFVLLQLEYKPHKYEGHKIMVAVVDPLPPSLGLDELKQMFTENDCQGYELLIGKSRVSGDTSRRRAMVYTKSKKSMCRVHKILYSQKVDGNLLPLQVSLSTEIPHPPKHHPYEDLFRPRKMPIVCDPVPDSVTEETIRELLTDCGKYDVKFTGSAVSEGSKRLIIQPRNTIAKENCFRILKDTCIDGTVLQPVRVPLDKIPPAIGSNDEEESDEEFERASG